VAIVPSKVTPIVLRTCQGSVKLADCGCPEDYINLDSAGIASVKDSPKWKLVSCGRDARDFPIGQFFESQPCHMEYMHVHQYITVLSIVVKVPIQKKQQCRARMSMRLGYESLECNT